MANESNAGNEFPPTRPPNYRKLLLLGFCAFFLAVLLVNVISFFLSPPIAWRAMLVGVTNSVPSTDEFLEPSEGDTNNSECELVSNVGVILELNCAGEKRIAKLAATRQIDHLPYSEVQGALDSAIASFRGGGEGPATLCNITPAIDHESLAHCAYGDHILSAVLIQSGMASVDFKTVRGRTKEEIKDLRNELLSLESRARRENRGLWANAKKTNVDRRIAIQSWLANLVVIIGASAAFYITFRERKTRRDFHQSRLSGELTDIIRRLQQHSRRFRETDGGEGLDELEQVLEVAETFLHDHGRSISEYDGPEIQGAASEINKCKAAINTFRDACVGGGNVNFRPVSVQVTSLERQLRRVAENIVQ